MEGNHLTVMAAVLVTAGRIERESFAAETHRGVMPFEPGHAEDNIVSGDSDVQAKELDRAGGMDEKGIIVVRAIRARVQ
jgi:hypothetical protein